MAVPVTGCWTFFCNPKSWDVDGFLRTDPIDSFYLIADYHIQSFEPGHFGVIRVGKDERTKAALGGKPKLNAGVYAIVQVTSAARLRTVEDNEIGFWVAPPPPPGKRHVVDIRYIKNLVYDPLLLTDLEQYPGITDKYLIKGHQAATFPLDTATFGVIAELASGGDLWKGVSMPPADTLAQRALLEAMFTAAVPTVREQISRRIERGAIAETVKKATGRKCLLCEAFGEKPYPFKKEDGEWFIEAHHVIPVASFVPCSLGPSNIITVCPNHHRQLHYGDVKLQESLPTKFIFIIDGVPVEVQRVYLEMPKTSLEL